MILIRIVVECIFEVGGIIEKIEVVVVVKISSYLDKFFGVFKQDVQNEKGSRDLVKNKFFSRKSNLVQINFKFNVKIERKGIFLRL